MFRTLVEIRFWTYVHGARRHDVAQEPVSRLEQFGGVPDVDPDLPEKKPRAKGKAKAKAKAASKAKAKASPKAKGRPRKPAVEKAQPKRKASNNAAKVDDDSVDHVQDVEVHPTTPKRRAPKKEQVSRSKRKNENKARKSQGSGKKVSKEASDMNQPKKPRASKGQATSFARRDPPQGERLKAEWVAIRDAYRATLNHLLPVTKHEDNSGLMVSLFPKSFHQIQRDIYTAHILHYIAYSISELCAWKYGHIS